MDYCHYIIDFLGEIVGTKWNQHMDYMLFWLSTQQYCVCVVSMKVLGQNHSTFPQDVMVNSVLVEGKTRIIYSMGD